MLELQIMKILQIPIENYENHKNLKIPFENHENHENLKLQQEICSS